MSLAISGIAANRTNMRKVGFGGPAQDSRRSGELVTQSLEKAIGTIDDATDPVSKEPLFTDDTSKKQAKAIYTHLLNIHKETMENAAWDDRTKL